MTDLKIPFCRLYERRSKSTGMSYLSGRLGDLRLLMFRENDVPESELYGSDGRWQVFVAPADSNFRERAERPQRPALAVASPGWRDK